MITIKEIAKEIKKVIKTSHQDINRLSVKSKQGTVYVTWYDMDTDMIADVVENLLNELSQGLFIELNGVELWREYSSEYMSNHDWMREKRRKVIKFSNKVERVIENKIDMIAEMATVKYMSDRVDVIFSSGSRNEIVEMKLIESWSHKKYVQEAINNTVIKIGYDFKYTWEYE